jgi:hypothetical protein
MGQSQPNIRRDDGKGKATRAWQPTGDSVSARMEDATEHRISKVSVYFTGIVKSEGGRTEEDRGSVRRFERSLLPVRQEPEEARDQPDASSYASRNSARPSLLQADGRSKRTQDRITTSSWTRSSDTAPVRNVTRKYKETRQWV